MYRKNIAQVIALHMYRPKSNSIDNCVNSAVSYVNATAEQDRRSHMCFKKCHGKKKIFVSGNTLHTSHNLTVKNTFMSSAKKTRTY